MSDEPARCTTSGKPWTEGSRGLLPNGQQKDYVVLCEEERAKGFVRPVRHSYRHVGIAGPTFPTRELDSKQEELFGGNGYVAFEPYPEGHHGSSAGRYWNAEDLARIGRGCGATTTMGQKLAETYARDPGFYGATFCVGCGTHLPVGKDGEFVWAGTNERVGA